MLTFDLHGYSRWEAIGEVLECLKCQLKLTGCPSKIQVTLVVSGGNHSRPARGVLTPRLGPAVRNLLQDLSLTITIEPNVIHCLHFLDTPKEVATVLAAINELQNARAKTSSCQYSNKIRFQGYNFTSHRRTRNVIMH